MKINVIIDASQFVYACHFIWQQGNRNAETFEQTIVNNIHSFVEKLKAEIPIDKVVVALDSRPYFRSAIYPPYKEQRPESNIDWITALQVLRDNFDCLGFLGLEADDIIYLYADKYHKGDTVVLLVSSDLDHTQTTDKVGCLQFCHRKWSHIPKDPRKLWRSKLILGCKGDNVPSIVPEIHTIVNGLPVIKKQRVGEKTLEKLFDGGATVKDIMLKYKIDPNGADAQRNAQLIIYDHFLYKSWLGADYDRIINEI